MVEYTTWVSLGHDVYKSKNGQYNGREAAQTVTQTLATYWSENKDRLKGATESQARQILQKEMKV